MASSPDQPLPQELAFVPQLVEPDNQTETPHSHVAARTKLPWAMGGFADALMLCGTGGLLTVVFVNGLNVNPALVNLAITIPRFVDSFTDPVVGYLSDNTRSRWGRRRPWMLAGLIVSALAGVLLWFPPLGTQGAAPTGFLPLMGYCLANPIFWHLAMVCVLLYAVGYTMFNITHTAMGYELTDDYNERTHLFKWRYIAFSAAGFVISWLYPLALAFEGEHAQEWKGSHGALTVSFIIGAFILLSGLPAVLFCKEKVIAESGKKKVSFRNAVKMTLDNKPFWLLVVSNLVTKFCMNVTGIFFAFIILYHIAGGNMKAGSVYLAVFFNTISIANMLAMAPVASLSDRIGKKACLLSLLLMSAVTYISFWFTFTSAPGSFFILTLPFLGNVSLQWPCLISAVGVGIFTSTIPMLNNSMLADVCDLDELHSGHRREAFYSAVFTTIDKIAMGISSAFQGFLLVASGFDSLRGSQLPETIAFWLLAITLTQPVGFLLGSIAVSFYPLTRERCDQIRTQLHAMRAASGPAPDCS